MLYWYLELYPVDSTGTSQPQYLSVDGVTTTGPTNPHRRYDAFLLDTPNLHREVARGLQGGEANVSWDTMKIMNPRGDLDHWRDLFFKGHPVILRSSVNGSRDYSTWEERAVGTIAAIREDRESEVWEIEVRGRELELDRDFVIPRFTGLGPWCLRTTAAGGEKVDFGDVLDATGAHTWQIRFRPADVTTSNQGLIEKVSAGTGWYLRLNPSAIGDGRLRYKNFAVTTGGTLTTSQVLYDDRDAWIWVVTNPEDTTFTIYVWDEVDGFVDAGSSTYTGSLGAGTAHNLEMMIAALGDTCTVRYWSRALSIEDCKQTLYYLEAETGLANQWSFGEGFGSTINDDIGALNGTLTGGSWVRSLEGGQELAGQYQPSAWGNNKNIQPIRVDGPNNVYRNHYTAIESNALFDRGVALIEGVAANYNDDLTLGTVEYHTPHVEGDGGVTADVEGDKGDGTYRSTVADLVRLWVTTPLGPWTDPDDLVTASFTGLTDPGTVGYYMPSGGKIRQAIQELTAGLRIWTGCRADGKFEIGTIAAPSVGGSADHDLAANEILEIEVLEEPDPVESTTLGGMPNRTIQLADQLASSFGLTPAVDPARRAFVSKEYRFEKFPGEAADVGGVAFSTIYPQAANAGVREPIVQGVQSQEVGALGEVAAGSIVCQLAAREDLRTEAKELHTLAGTAGRLWLKVLLAIDLPGLDLAQEVDLTHPWINGGMAKRFVIMAWSTGEGPYGSLTLWG